MEIAASGSKGAAVTCVLLPLFFNVALGYVKEAFVQELHFAASTCTGQLVLVLLGVFEQSPFTDARLFEARCVLLVAAYSSENWVFFDGRDEWVENSVADEVVSYIRGGSHTICCCVFFLALCSSQVGAVSVSSFVIRGCRYFFVTRGKAHR